MRGLQRTIPPRWQKGAGGDLRSRKLSRSTKQGKHSVQGQAGQGWEHPGVMEGGSAMAGLYGLFQANPFHDFYVWHSRESQFL